MLTDGFGESLHSENVKHILYSANGSKKLSNGIILLEEEDIEAYLNGTLVFYSNEVETM